MIILGAVTVTIIMVLGLLFGEHRPFSGSFISFSCGWCWALAFADWVLEKSRKLKGDQ